jgi:predicted ATP-binding protein involved in virulence
MIVTGLKLTNVRAIETAEFKFKPGFNLIVGVNGVGKTTVLDSLCACLEPVSRHVNKHVGNTIRIADNDIRVLADAMTLQAEFEFAGAGGGYLIHRQRETSVAQSGKEGLPREQSMATPSIAEFVDKKPSIADGKKLPRPLMLFFSTRRAIASDKSPTKSTAQGAYKAAFAEAFAHRELRIAEFAAWLRAQKALSSELRHAGRTLQAFEQAVSRFLPQYSNLRVDEESNAGLLIDRNGMTIPVRQLSDGERGTLSLVLDLTRRLAQANPQLEDPAAQGSGVVLIDEIDLHLHPKWQREIVHQLLAAFPKLQFIATTHSPQVIGELESERIQIIHIERGSGKATIYSPDHSFGVDSSRVLEEIMDASSRALRIQQLLDKLSKLVDEKKIQEAGATVEQLAEKLGENDADVIRARTLLDFLGGEE